MTTYAVRADLLAYLPASTIDDMGSEAEIDAKLLQAQSRVDSVLRDRYTLPLSVVDPAIKDAVCRLARYELMLAHGSNQSGAIDFYERDRDAVLRFLSDVSLRKASLDVGQTDGRADDTEADQGPLAVATNARRGYHFWTR